MDTPTNEQYEKCIADLAQFCFRKLASLEARFLILCHRAEALGIETNDIRGVDVVEDRTKSPVGIVN
jgi:hypothetical protein